MESYTLHLKYIDYQQIHESGEGVIQDGLAIQLGKTRKLKISLDSDKNI